MKRSSPYDPFAAGPHHVLARTAEIEDAARGRVFPWERWAPAGAAASVGERTRILYSHASRGSRRGAAFLATHLASHGFVVDALDHSEVVAPELAARPGESAEARL